MFPTIPVVPAAAIPMLALPPLTSVPPTFDEAELFIPPAPFFCFARTDCVSEGLPTGLLACALFIGHGLEQREGNRTQAKERWKRRHRNSRLMMLVVDVMISITTNSETLP